VGERDIELLRRFDQTFGTRRFPIAGSRETRYPWQEDEGFAAMMDSTFRPVLDNRLREEVGRYECAELVASCSLVQHTAPTEKASSNANRNIAKVEARIGRALSDGLSKTLGGDYFRDIRVRIGRVTLPTQVQGEINDVQTKYVAINGARAEVTRARYEAKRNELRAHAYNSSPALARIDAIKAAPPGTTIVLSGDSKQPGINVGG
jgi:regulator of protease activity HflC (stomatin/prohibitin superfamily)